MAVIDRMMAAPAKAAPEPVRNPHTGAAAAVSAAPPPPPVLGPKGTSVERPSLAKDALDEAAELFRVIFKGDIVP